MKAIPAVYEKGVFRPTVPVNLPEGTLVQLSATPGTIDVQTLVPVGTADEQIEIYECLAKSYETGDPEAAARHNEHQP